MANERNAYFSIKDTKVTYKNFSGAEQRYNPAGKRNFHIYISEEQANVLRDAGLNVKDPYVPDSIADDPTKDTESYMPQYRLKINVNANSQFNRFTLTKFNSETNEILESEQLNANTLGQLDNLPIVKMNLTFNAWEYDPKDNPGKRTAWATNFEAFVDVSKFMNTYEL